MDKAEISARHCWVILIFTASSESLSWSAWRAPMMGAVMAGWDITQATAKAAGIDVLSRGEIGLRGQNDFIPAILNQFSQNFLGPASIVNIGRIEEIDSGLPAAVKD